MRLRIGVHQGEVVAKGDDLLGDGVIIATRLEPLAEPGGICISGRVREDAAGKVALEMEGLGTPPLKNIAAGGAFGFSLAYFVDGDYERVLDWTAEELRQFPTDIVALRYRIAALGLLGRLDEARHAVNRVLVLNPALTISRCRRHVEVGMKNPYKRPGVAEAYYEGLRRAGLPE